MTEDQILRLLASGLVAALVGAVAAEVGNAKTAGLAMTIAGPIAHRALDDAVLARLRILFRDTR